jgi:23S rRNA (adenine1618-N6)-methyltransferase
MGTDNKTKKGLHSSNKHRGLYEFDALTKVVPQLKSLIKLNPKGQKTIDFSDPQSVKLLNKALLAHYYRVEHWDIPQGYLCPPIPGRADYVHRLADLLVTEMPTIQGNRCRMLDIGTGANCIYPLIAAAEYRWSVVGTDVASAALNNALRIVQNNPQLAEMIRFRLQPDPQAVFANVIEDKERFELSMCNPPFHGSEQEAKEGSAKKVRNLARPRASFRGDGPSPRIRQSNNGVAKSTKEPNQAVLNFGGQQAELWCEGGELAFISRMANESKRFSSQVLWFSTLISKNDNVRPMKRLLARLGVVKVHVEEMQQGHKTSRFIAWTFQTAEQRKIWLESRC